MNKYRYFKHWRDRTKSRAVEAFGNKCGICGYDKCTAALEFHHTNPKEKEFSISSLKVNNWNLLVKELKKCICVCSNCHKEIHYNGLTIPNNIKRFDISFEIYKHEQTQTACPVCGKMKEQTKKYCSIGCRYDDVKKINWKQYDLKELVIIKKIPFTILSKQIGVSDNAIRKRMKKLGLPYTREMIENYK